MSEASTDGATSEGTDRATDRATPQAPKSVFRQLLPRLILSLVLGAAVILLVKTSSSEVELLPKPQAFKHVLWWTIPAYVGVLFVSHFFRASRWRFLIAPIKKLPLRDVVFLNWIGFFAIFAFPLRLGEFARPALTKARCGIPISAGFGTVAVERVVDGVITSLCVAWAVLFLERQPTEDPIALAVPRFGMMFLALFTTVLIALVVFLWQEKLATQLTERVIGIVHKPLAKKLAAKVASVADGVRSMKSPRLTAAFIFESLLYWGTNAFGMWLLAWGCGIDLSIGQGFALMGVLAMGILLPAGPGLFGPFQLAIFAGLRLYVPESVVVEEGEVYTFLLFLIQAVFITVVGVLPLYLMKIPFSVLLKPPSLKDEGP